MLRGGGAPQWTTPKKIDQLVCMSGGCRRGFECNLIAESLQPVDQAILGVQMMALIEVG
jgi:hypothetical protein